MNKRNIKNAVAFAVICIGLLGFTGCNQKKNKWTRDTETVKIIDNYEVTYGGLLSSNSTYWKTLIETRDGFRLDDIKGRVGVIGEEVKVTIIRCNGKPRRAAK